MSIWKDTIVRNAEGRVRTEKTVGVVTPEEMKRATPEDLIEWLNKYIVLFTFKKKDKTLRDAWGTRNKNVIEYIQLKINNRYKGGGTEAERYGYKHFFDIEKGGWASVHPGSLVDVHAVITPQEFEESEEELPVIDLSGMYDGYTVRDNHGIKSYDEWLEDNK